MPDDAPVHDPGIEETEITPVQEKAPPEKINKGLFGDDDDPDVHVPDDEEEARKAEAEAAKKKPAKKPAAAAKGDEEGEEEPEAEEEEPAEEGEEAEEAGAKDKKEEDENDNDFEVDVEMTINGKSVQKTYTLQELTRFAQKAHAADERFEQAKQHYEAAKGQITQFRKAPFETLDRLVRSELERNGMPKLQARGKAAEYIRLMANRYLAPFIEEANLPEPERRKRELEREIDDLNLQRSNMLKEQEEQELQAKAEAQAQQLRRALRASFQQMSVKMNDDLEARASDRFYAYIDRGIQITPQEAASEILREREEYLRGYLERAEPDELLRLRPDLGTRISQTNLQKVTRAQEAALSGETAAVPEQDSDQPRPKRKKPKTFSTWEDMEKDAGPVRWSQQR